MIMERKQDDDLVTYDMNGKSIIAVLIEMRKPDDAVNQYSDNASKKIQSGNQNHRMSFRRSMSLRCHMDNQKLKPNDLNDNPFKKEFIMWLIIERHQIKLNSVIVNIIKGTSTMHQLKQDISHDISKTPSIDLYWETLVDEEFLLE